MRVSVYLMRQKGERLTREAMAASTPAQGYIRVTREPGGRLGQWQRTALLKATPESLDVQLQLHEVQIQSWDHRGVVLAGVEIQWRRGRERDVYRQAWFVVPSPEGDAAVNSDRPRTALNSVAA